jgi:hypothetical protein
MGKYDETRARQILEAAADVLAPDLEARRDAARELIKEVAGLAGATRIRALAVNNSEARLGIADHVVAIRFDGLTWQVQPDGGAPVTVHVDFDPHERKFIGVPAEDKDGLAILLEAATTCLKTIRQTEAVQRALGGIGSIRH